MIDTFGSWVNTKRKCDCTFCGEEIAVGGNCRRWIGFYEGLFTGTESAHPECYKGKEGFESWRKGQYIRGSMQPRGCIPAENPFSGDAETLKRIKEMLGI